MPLFTREQVVERAASLAAFGYDKIQEEHPEAFTAMNDPAALQDFALDQVAAGRTELVVAANAIHNLHKG